MPDYNTRMREGMILLHVNDDDLPGEMETLYEAHLSARRKEQIIANLTEWCADGNIWDDE